VDRCRLSGCRRLTQRLSQHHRWAKRPEEIELDLVRYRLTVQMAREELRRVCACVRACVCVCVCVCVCLCVGLSLHPKLTQFSGPVVLIVPCVLATTDAEPDAGR
jgi:hypothetical protein